MEDPGSSAGLISLIRRRFAGRQDTEHEQALIRLVIGAAVFFYFFFFSLRGSVGDGGDDRVFVWVMVAFIVASVGLILHIAFDPRISPPRRVLACVLDIGTVTYFFFNADEHALPLYFLYLWIIFGYGFRFGRHYLLLSLGMSLAGFGTAIFSLEYWLRNQFLGIGLWVGMLLVSLYVNALTGRLRVALQNAEAANQAKRRFISSVSHELRTPLNAIIGMGELLRGTKLNPEQEDMLRSLDNASHVMLALIEDVLDFSKIEAGKLVIENTAFDLHQLIVTTVDIFRYQANERGLVLQTFIDPAAPSRLHGDPHHLRQVLVNLLSNAVKFTHKGKITLRVQHIGTAENGAQLRFEVEDTGIGIAEEAQQKVFESFTQADESTTRRYGGTGLGTTISKQLVELMGGRLGLRSQLGVGSTFWFELTLMQDAQYAVDEAFAGLRTLLVGFSGDAQAELATVLTGVAAPWQAAATLDDSLSRLIDANRQQHPFRLALLSEQCVSGLSHTAFLPPLIKELRAKGGADLAVVLCGGGGVVGDRRQVMEDAGLTAWLDDRPERRLLLNVMHAAKLFNEKVADPEALLPGVEETAAPRATGEQYNILVAEDNPTNRKVIQKILERAGHRCTLVENGEEALDQLGQQDFDAVVFDMNMPVMNGLEATKAYRFMQPSDMRLPIIMFSANVTMEAREDCLAAGVDEFLPKPIQVAPFLEALDRLIKKFGSNQRNRVPHRSATKLPILAQPPGDEIVLNYATLAELDRIGQDRAFVDGLLTGFVADNRVLIEKLEGMLIAMRFEEFKETLHAIKGSAVSIGALAMKNTCAQFEKMSHADLKRDTRKVLQVMRGRFDELCQALEHYRKQRDQSASNH